MVLATWKNAVTAHAALRLVSLANGHRPGVVPRPPTTGRAAPRTHLASWRARVEGGSGRVRVGTAARRTAMFPRPPRRHSLTSGRTCTLLSTVPVTSRSSAMTHRPIHAPNLPKPVGPYSPGMGFERLVFVSGQGATDPATGTLAGADAASQTAQCLRNVETILLAAGTDLQHVLRCGVFLLDMAEFTEMNGVYERMFGDHRPARTTIQAAGLPAEGLRVEIDCIAYIP